MFWLLTMLCLMTYGCVMPFNYIATGLFTSTSLRDMPSKEGRKIAGIYMGIPFFIILFIKWDNVCINIYILLYNDTDYSFDSSWD